MSKLALITLTLSTTLLASAPAVADDAPTTEAMARATVARARRAVALGPVGGAAGGCTTDGTCDGQVALGLGLYLFDVPVVPTLTSIEDRVKARVTQRLKEMITEGKPAPTADDLARIAAEVKAEVMAEFAGEVAPHTLERPTAKLVLEAGYQLRAAAWQARATAGVGAGPVSLGVTLAGTFADRTSGSVGPEVALHLTLGDGPRTQVIDLFGRADLVFARRDTAHDTITIGARFLFDLI
jgi:hypothetical protein